MRALALILAFAQGVVYAPNAPPLTRSGGGAPGAATVQLLEPEDVLWTTRVGVVVVPGNTLVKVHVDGWDNAGAVSMQQLASGDGYVEIVASETGTGRAFGLSNGNAGISLEEIAFGIAILGDGTGIHIFESGEERLYAGYPTGYTTGDRLRVAVEGGAVTYRHNGVLLYTSLVAPTYPILVDTSLYHQGATIAAAVISNW